MKIFERANIRDKERERKSEQVENEMKYTLPMHHYRMYAVTIYQSKVNISTFVDTRDDKKSQIKYIFLKRFMLKMRLKERECKTRDDESSVERGSSNTEGRKQFT